MNFAARSAGLSGWMVDVRRDLHRNPELSLKEERTGGIVAAFLEEWGYRIRRVGGTGVHGFLEGAPGAPVIAIRADIDALPVQENTGLEFASACPGIMHACGHDIHTACALGAARMLAEAKREGGFSGGVVMLFQPAEELNKGAEALLRDGALDDPHVTMIFGLHNHPAYPARSVVLKEGPIMAAVDMLKIRILGVGSHGAIPHLSADPVVAAASVVLNLQTIVSRNVDPLDAAVITIGKVHGGAANNVIPEDVELNGTVRSFRPEVRDALHARIETVAASVATGLGCRAVVEIRRDLPAVTNDARSYACCFRAASEVVGTNGIIQATPSMGGEDFALYQGRIPGCMFWLGVGNEGIGAVHPWHSPKFVADESAIPVGAAVLAQSVVVAMNG